MRIVLSLLAALTCFAPVGAGSDPFAYFHPTLALGVREREVLDGGTPIVRFLPATGREVGAFTAIALPPDVTEDRAAAWMRRVELLRENPYVLATQRLSSPPRLADFDRLWLDEEDVDDIRSCVPGRCGIKLSIPEIHRLRGIAAEERDPGRARLQRAFRELLLQRALTFTAGGPAALDNIVDKRHPVSPGVAFANLLEHTAFLGLRIPDVSRALLGCAGAKSGGESFLYWSKERLGGRPVIMLTHVLLLPSYPREPLMMIGTQVYASHYLDASLTVTAFVPHELGERGYFVYLHRSSVDLLSGFWGGLARSLIESKARKDGPMILRRVSERMAAGDPPVNK